MRRSTLLLYLLPVYPQNGTLVVTMRDIPSERDRPLLLTILIIAVTRMNTMFKQLTRITFWVRSASLGL